MSVIADIPDMRPSLLLDFVNTRRTHPSLTSTRASTATVFGADGVLTTLSNNVPRIAYDPTTGSCLGLLIEGAKTNIVVRNQTTGAAVGVIGSGGSMPTTWSSTPKATSGLDTEVVGVGTENGLPYVDVRFFGTPVVGYQGVIFGNVSGYATSTEYSGSVFAKVISGTAGGAGSMQLQARYNTASGSTNIGANFTPSQLGGDLRNQRLITNGTTDATATGTGQFLLVFNLTNGTAYDFTVRLAVPQLEAGTATSVIFTNGSAATRAADAVLLDLPAYSDLSVTTEFTHSLKLKNTRALGLYAAGATVSNIAVIAANSANTASAGVIASPAGPNTTIPGLSAVTGRTDKVAFSRAATGAMLASARGVSLVSGTQTGTTAPMLTLCLGNTTSVGAVPLDGYIRRVSLWRRSLTQAELNKLTTP